MSTDYTLMDATLEILLMLLAAFLLGWLFCWLMKKLFGGKPNTTTKHSSLNRTDPVMGKADASVDTDTQSIMPSAEAPEADVAIVAPKTNRPRIDLNEVDLPKTTRVEVPNAEVNAPEATIPRPRIDLPGLNTPDLDIKGKLDAGVGSGKATLSKGLGAAAAGLGSVAVGASAFKDKAVDKVNNLSVDVDTPDVEMPKGEFENLDVSLSDTEIDLPDFSNTELTTEIDLPEANSAEFATEIDLPEVPTMQTADVSAYGAKLDLESPLSSADLPDTDLSQAKSAIEDTVDAGKSKLSAGFGAAAAGVGAIAAGAGSIKDTAVEKVTDLTENLTDPDLPTTAAKTAEVDVNHVKPSGADDLSRISGIDDQVIGILKDKNIHTYQDLQASNRTQLKGYLDASGDSGLRALEPASWPHQATLCANRNWTKLNEYQSFLTGSNLDTRQELPSYEVSDGDDLKKVEGIGPFFESLLNEAGITTYEQLKNSDRDTLKEIIDAAGPDYRMHEPETWPYQAGLAYRGEWKKLQDYIHFMTGRS